MAEKLQKDEMIFEQARLAYPGRKRGFQVEWDYFRRVVRNWKTVIPLLGPAIERQAKERELLKSKGEFCPAWKDFKSWLLNHYWELSTPELDNQAKKKKTESDTLLKQARRDLKTYRKYIEENIDHPEKLKGIPQGALYLYNKERQKLEGEETPW